LAAALVAAFAASAVSPAAFAQSGNMVHIDPAFKADPAMLQKLAPVLSEMGSGHNSLTGEILGAGGCVTGTIIPPDESGASSPSYQMQLVSSYEEFTQDTRVEAEVSGSFGKFSASVKSSFERSETSHSTSKHLLIRETVETAAIKLNNPRLKIGKSLMLLAGAKNPEQYDLFMRACGDGYVSTIHMGGEFIAMLNYDSTDDQVKQSVKVSAAASYGGASGSSDFSNDMSSLRSQTNLSVTMTRLGGSGDLPVVTADGGGTIDALLQYASQLPSNVTAHPVIFDVAADPYVQLGIDLPQNAAAAAAYKSLRDDEQRLGLRIGDLRLAQRTYDLLSLPLTPSPTDIRHVATTNLAAAERDLAIVTPIVETCGATFWRPHSCDAPAQFLANYEPPKTPVLIVRQLDVKSWFPIAVSLDAPMKVGLRGVYCFSGDDRGRCLVNGAYNMFVSDQAYVQLRGPGIDIRYDGGEHDAGPGVLTVQVLDGDYGDNQGELYFVAYQK
jgi:hypothetical protein